MLGGLAGYLSAKLGASDAASSRNFILASVTAAITWESARLLYSFYVDKSRIPKMLRTFEKGTSEPVVAALNLIHRERELGHLERALNSRKVNHTYFLITGNVGTGKTQIMKYACHHAGPGVLYMAVPSDDPYRFGEVLAKRIGFRFDEAVSFVKSLKEYFLSVDDGERPQTFASDDPTFRRVLPWLRKSAYRYYLKYGRPLTLVIDDLDLLIRQVPTVVSTLLQVSKQGADEGYLRMCLMASHGAPLGTLLKEEALCSRMVVIEIGDLSRDQACELIKSKMRSVYIEICKEKGYSTKMCKANNGSSFPCSHRNMLYGEPTPPNLTADDVNSLVDLVGGRLALLNQCISLLMHGHTPAVVRSRLLNAAARSLGLNQLLLVESDDPDVCVVKYRFWNAMRILCDRSTFEVRLEELLELLKNQAAIRAVIFPGAGDGEVTPLITGHPSTGMFSVNLPTIRYLIRLLVGKEGSPERQEFNLTLRRLKKVSGIEEVDGTL